jgi:alcohol dehydrogenase
MNGFDYQPRTRLIFGPGSVDRIGSLVAEWSARRVLIVTDPQINQAGHPARAAASLAAVGIEAVIYDQVRENPTTEDVDACLAVARSAAIDTFIGLGGGSSMDTAKGANFLLTNGGAMRDYWGIGKATKPMLPLIAVPTTAGTGSECQSFALIADAVTHQKMACGDPKAAPRIALLDPTLTLTQPRRVAADTGIDALTHAVEAAVTTKRTELSLLFAREAFKLIISAFRCVLDAPTDLDARGRMMLGASYAGIAIENSMLGAAHACANPLTAHFGVVHGRAVGLMLPAVIRHNAADPVARSLYHALALHGGLIPDGADGREAVASLLDCIEGLLHTASSPRTLSQLNIPRDAIATLAAGAAKQWTGTFNPRPMTEADFASLYESTY